MRHEHSCGLALVEDSAGVTLADATYAIFAEENAHAFRQESLTAKEVQDAVKTLASRARRAPLAVIEVASADHDGDRRAVVQWVGVDPQDLLAEQVDDVLRRSIRQRRQIWRSISVLPADTFSSTASVMK